MHRLPVRMALAVMAQFLFPLDQNQKILFSTLKILIHCARQIQEIYTEKSNYPVFE